jgi:hypothetical protein
MLCHYNLCEIFGYWEFLLCYYFLVAMKHAFGMVKGTSFPQDPTPPRATTTTFQVNHSDARQFRPIHHPYLEID